LYCNASTIDKEKLLAKILALDACYNKLIALLNAQDKKWEQSQGLLLALLLLT